MASVGVVVAVVVGVVVAVAVVVGVGVAVGVGVVVAVGVGVVVAVAVVVGVAVGVVVAVVNFMEPVSKSEIAYFLHRLVSIIADNVEDKDKRNEISLMHNDIYMYLEKPKV